jgi:hypothetical protein
MITKIHARLQVVTKTFVTNKTLNISKLQDRSLRNYKITANYTL